MENIKLGIIGAGEFGEHVLHLTRICGINVSAFFDDTKKNNEIISNVPVFGPIDTISRFYSKGIFTHLICAIGYKHFESRERLFDYYHNKLNIPFATIIHPSCIIDPSAHIGQGCVIMAGCVFGENVNIENNVYIGTCASISHDSRIGENSYLGPRVAIAGRVNVGGKCFFGINSTIIDNVTIGRNIIIAAGTVVINNIGQQGMYAGVPATYRKETANFEGTEKPITGH